MEGRTKGNIDEYRYHEVGSPLHSQLVGPCQEGDNETGGGGHRTGSAPESGEGTHYSHPRGCQHRK